MTEKVKNGIEMTAVAVTSAGIDFLINKAVDSVYKPDDIPGKILCGVGKLGLSLGANYGVYKVVHGIMNPEEKKAYEDLITEYVNAVTFNSEVAKVMAEHQVKIENSVDDIYKKIMEGTNG